MYQVIPRDVQVAGNRVSDVFSLKEISGLLHLSFDPLVNNGRLMLFRQQITHTSINWNISGIYRFADLTGKCYKLGDIIQFTNGPSSSALQTLIPSEQ